MNDLLLKLREQLLAIVEEIDNFNISLDDTISIRKEDFKWLKFLDNSNSANIFEYKEDIKFILHTDDYNPYENSIYNQLMNGTLEVLILEKRKGSGITYKINNKSIQVNYKVQEQQNTLLRNLYSTPKD